MVGEPQAERDNGVQVGTGDGSERKDEHSQTESGGQGALQELESGVARREAARHDAGDRPPRSRAAPCRVLRSPTGEPGLRWPSARTTDGVTSRRRHAGVVLGKGLDRGRTQLVVGVRSAGGHRVDHTGQAQHPKVVGDRPSRPAPRISTRWQVHRLSRASSATIRARLGSETTATAGPAEAVACIMR